MTNRSAARRAWRALARWALQAMGPTYGVDLVRQHVSVHVVTPHAAAVQVTIAGNVTAAFVTAVERVLHSLSGALWEKESMMNKQQQQLSAAHLRAQLKIDRLIESSPAEARQLAEELYRRCFDACMYDEAMYWSDVMLRITTTQTIVEPLATAEVTVPDAPVLAEPLAEVVIPETPAEIMPDVVAETAVDAPGVEDIAAEPIVCADVDATPAEETVVEETTTPTTRRRRTTT